MKLFGVEHRPWSNRLRLLAFLTGAALILVMMINQYLTTPEAPQIITSYQLAGNPEQAQEIHEAWERDGGIWPRMSLILDLGFIALYAAFLVTLTNHFLIDRPGVREQKAGRLAKALFIFGAAADMAENLLLLAAISNPQSPTLPLSAAVATLGKFTGLILGAGGLLIVRAARRHPVQPEDWHAEHKQSRYERR